MTQAIGRYDAMWWSFTTRRRRAPVAWGLDGLVGRWVTRMRQVPGRVRRCRQLAAQVDRLGPQYQDLSEPELDERAARLREAFARRPVSPSSLTEAMACVREMAAREIGQRPHDTQVAAALALFHGQAAALAGATPRAPVVALAAVLAGWSHPSVHVVVANDFQAARDGGAMAPLLRRAGLAAAHVEAGQPRDRKLAAYRHPVVYVAARQLIGDWLRDQIRLGPAREAVIEHMTPVAASAAATERITVPGLHAAIVDDIDGTLLDDAISPLVISTVPGPHTAPDVLRRAVRLAGDLVADVDYIVHSDRRIVRLTDEGWIRLAEIDEPDEAGIDTAFWHGDRRRREVVERALAASICYERGRDYDVIEDRVIMIDPSTGQTYLPDRRRQFGVEQAIEAKEGLEITAERRTLASLSLQRFFRLYRVLCGVSSTSCRLRRRELSQMYGLILRGFTARRDRTFAATPRLVAATARMHGLVADEAERCYREGMPVLVVTGSAAGVRSIGDLLTERGMDAGQVTGVQPDREASALDRLAVPGAITVVGGQGGRLGAAADERDAIDASVQVIVVGHEPSAVRDAERLIGRAARNGPSNSCQLFISLEDLFYTWEASWVVKCLRRMYAAGAKAESGRVSSPRIVSRALIGWARRRIRTRAGDIRRSLVRRDDWLDRTMPLG